MHCSSQFSYSSDVREAEERVLVKKFTRLFRNPEIYNEVWETPFNLALVATAFGFHGMWLATLELDPGEEGRAFWSRALCVGVVRKLLSSQLAALFLTCAHPSTFHSGGCWMLGCRACFWMVLTG